MVKNEKKTTGVADSIRELYRIYEYADGLYFPDMKFRCGNIENYVKTGVLTEEDIEEIWKESTLLK